MKKIRKCNRKRRKIQILMVRLQSPSLSSMALRLLTSKSLSTQAITQSRLYATSRRKLSLLQKASAKPSQRKYSRQQSVKSRWTSCQLELTLNRQKIECNSVQAVNRLTRFSEEALRLALSLNYLESFAQERHNYVTLCASLARCRVVKAVAKARPCLSIVKAPLGQSDLCQLPSATTLMSSRFLTMSPTLVLIILTSKTSSSCRQRLLCATKSLRS